MRIGTRIHVRHDDGLRAAVERAVDQALLVAVDAYDRGHAPDVARPGQVAEIGGIDAAVFAFEPHAVESDGTEGVDVVGVGEPADDERRLAGLEFATDAVRA